jgi:hypothetical protein
MNSFNMVHQIHEKFKKFVLALIHLSGCIRAGSLDDDNAPASPVLMKHIPMIGPHISSGLSYGGNQFYGSGYPVNGTPSHGGNIYPHLKNPYHTFVSSHTFASVMMPIQKFID